MGLSLAPATQPPLASTEATASPIKSDPPSATHPRVRYFGDYELLEEIARGGMGVVYRARQTSLNRVVAVKMLLFGKFSSDEFVKRFRSEAQAVASLQHPNIVAIHEVGEHEGQHYFSMDFVAGKSLADVVRDNPLPAKRAAGFLEPIARAIHYAHQRGVLHRDLKPSNVLIDELDQPRITDLGLAKQLSGDPELTPTGQVLGSPSYMPPEQADAKRGALAAQSDVYSLGAILYHLLTGRPPFLAETLEDTLRQLLNNEPVAPRLLNISVPRDVETICLKCLNKDPHRRYGSADALAEDLKRWLAGEPISARPVGAGERIWCWSRRKPAIAGLSAAALFLLLAGTAVSTWQAVKAKRAERFALAESAGNDKVVAFLQQMLEGIPRSLAQGRDPKMIQELVDEAAARMDKEVPTHHRAEANLRNTIGRIYAGLGEYAKAEAMFRVAMTTERQMHGPDHPHVARDLAYLAHVLLDQGKLAEAETTIREALTIGQKGVGDEFWEREEAHSVFAAVLMQQGKFTEAETLLRQVLEARRKRFGEEHPDVVRALQNLNAVLLNQGKLAEAEKMQRQVLALRRRLVPSEPTEVARSLHNLAAMLSAQSKYAEATPLLREALTLRQKEHGAEHPDTVESLLSLGSTLATQQQMDEAEPMLRQALATQEQMGRGDSPLTATALDTLAWLLERQGKLAEAETVMTQALTLSQKIFGPENPQVAQSIAGLASIRKKQGRLKNAEELQREALAMRMKILGPEHLQTTKSLHNLGVTLRDEREFAEADEKFQAALTIRRKILTADHPDIAATLYEYAGSLQDQGRLPEAGQFYRQALDMRTKVLGAEDPETMESLNDLANLLGRRSQFVESEKRYQELLAVRQKVFGPEHLTVATAFDRITFIRWEQGKQAEAESAFREALPIYRKLLGEGDTNAIVPLNRFAWQVLAGQEKLTEAEGLLREMLATVKKVRGEDDPIFAERLQNLGSWLIGQGGLDEAERLMNQALATRTKLFGDDHADVIQSLAGLGRLYAEQGKLTEAEATFRKAVTIEKNRSNHRQRQVIDLLSDLLIVLKKQQDHVASEPVMLEANDLAQQDSQLPADEKRAWIEKLWRFYIDWATASPGTGKMDKASEWRRKLTAFDETARTPKPGLNQD